MSVFVAATFAGPVAGPIVGGFVTTSRLGWHWMAWLALIVGASFGLISFVVIPETYRAVLSQTRARKPRLEAKSQALSSKV